jgi:hypothetical protein
MDPEQLPLRDLHLPPDISWWPLAPGWWVLLAILAVGLGWLLYQSLLRWRAGKPRRTALRQLVQLKKAYQQSGNTQRLGIDLSELLRRAMLAYAPRSEVAGLAGESWLDWLDQGMDEKAFSEGAGKMIESLPYRNPELDAQGVDVEALIDAVHKRLQTPITGSTG